MNPIQFITGTDTGVGKTVWTGCLLHTGRRLGRDVAALKPFCTGPRTDVHLLQSLQPGVMRDEECNPWWFRAPITPAWAARMEGHQVDMQQVERAIRKRASQHETLLVEGAGGLMSPLGNGYTFCNLIERMKGDVWVVASNRLGALNQVLLCVEMLRKAKVHAIRVMLMQPGRRENLAQRTNLPILKEWIGENAVHRVPFLGRNPLKMSTLKINRKKLEKVLAGILDSAIFCAP